MNIIFLRLQGEVAEKMFVKNKMAQIFALMFIVDYPLKVQYCCVYMLTVMMFKT